MSSSPNAMRPTQATQGGRGAGDEPVGRPKRKGELTAERILDVAANLFAERGFAGTTLRDVAEGVGLRVPSLYNHFESKESLYAAVLERGMRPLLETLSEFVDRAEAGDENSRELIDRVARQLAARPELTRMLQHETLSGGERLTPMLREWIGPIFARGQEMIERTPGAASWPADQLPLLLIAMIHVLTGYFNIAPLYRELAGDDLLAPEALERHTAFFHALVARLFEEPQA